MLLHIDAVLLLYRLHASSDSDTFRTKSSYTGMQRCTVSSDGK